MKSYQHYLFDWDGCLGKTLDVWLDGYRQTYNEFRLPQTDHEITTHSFNNQNGPSERGIEDQEAFMKALIGRVDSGLRTVDMYPGAKEIITEIRKRGNSVSLITSSPRSIIDHALTRNEVTDLFDLVVTGDDVIKHKPDPEVITIALKHFGSANRDSAVIIGDSRSDLGAAQNAGIDSILFFPTSHHLFYDIEALKKYQPTHIFGSFDDLLLALS